MVNRENLEEIERLLVSSKHLLEITYSKLKDPKILLQICINLEIVYFLIREIIRGSKINEDRIKLIGSLDLLEIEKKYAVLKEIKENYDLGPASFKFKEDYVVCAKNYKVQVISFTFAKEYLDFGWQKFEKIKEI